MEDRYYRSIGFPFELRKRLLFRAKKTGNSESSIIRSALVRYLDEVEE